MQMRPFAIILVVFAALAGGCWIWLDRSLGERTIDITPALSGDVLAGYSDRRALTEEQLNAVSHWLAAHLSGWQTVIETAPAPSIVIELRHVDGTTTALDIYHNPPSPPGWNGAIVVRQFGAGKLAQSGEQKLSAADLSKLLRLIAQ
jgi:hypothetical protein